MNSLYYDFGHAQTSHPEVNNKTTRQRPSIHDRENECHSKVFWHCNMLMSCANWQSQLFGSPVIVLISVKYLCTSMKTTTVANF